ncbi:MAG TPA: hypothetical protein VGC65_09425 [Bacteroidia bacterium]|jgi:hypothetical protein
MKKTFLAFGLLFAGCMTMSSCRKEYDCTCKVTLSDGSVNEYSTNITASKKKAQQACDDSAPDSDFGKTCTLD